MGALPPQDRAASLQTQVGESIGEIDFSRRSRSWVTPGNSYKTKLPNGGIALRIQMFDIPKL
ncbi:hypothetical protein BJP36_37345 [Moorena producens JHB]|uniref:Uncharacterized protein n=1 Tax=Moorena producens (strain JHB) TaxID=1454205 RepID=A0A9Q9SU87_MOOP1|nr:hypothetical protein [Moorena producens]WAN69762.1 hypothetical protein BJP36_37345 [Moorena producens JHB]